MSDKECPMCEAFMTDYGDYYVCEWCGYVVSKADC